MSLWHAPFCPVALPVCTSSEGVDSAKENVYTHSIESTINPHAAPDGKGARAGISHGAPRNFPCTASVFSCGATPTGYGNLQGKDRHILPKVICLYVSRIPGPRLAGSASHG